MKIIDIYPGKAQYEKHQKVEILLELNGVCDTAEITLILDVYELHHKIATITRKIRSNDNKLSLTLEDINFDGAMAGFGVTARILAGDTVIDERGTSFDIVESWKLAPRYGFLSDFFEKDRNDRSDIEQMNKYHINVVQFYDWMYRHHELLPRESTFIDILGRELSIEVVGQKISYAHEFGMKTMAYCAVYGAETEFYSEHREWGLYKNEGTPMGFIDFIYLMDISRECGWHDHIIGEFMKAIKFGFDGIHMDQYGFPKQAISKVGGGNKVRQLRQDYANLIDDMKDHAQQNGCNAELIFNAVNNYPIDMVANTKQDAMYIEVWSPNDTYQDLYDLIVNAKNHNKNKQVILAAYMKPFSKNVSVENKHAENATLLTMATIFASGGFHLLLGENQGILSEPYYPDHKCIEAESFQLELRNYYDFIVQYEKLLFDLDIVDYTKTLTGGINGEYVFENVNASTKANEGNVWTLIKEKPGFKIIHLVNFCGLEETNWDKPKKNRPELVENITVTALVMEEVEGIYAISPDRSASVPKKLEFEYVKHDQGRAVSFVVPAVDIWEVVYITLK